MRLANPAGLAAAALAVPLVVWYLLRVRRPAVTVASTLLWSRTDRSTTAAVPWQRFRPDATFWLILAALLAGALALAGPYVAVPTELGDHTILVVDASASMLADEDGPSRLELARRRALELVGRLGPGQLMSVVEAGSRGRAVLSASPDARAIRRALSAIRPSHGPADLVDAFTLAAALERPGQATVVHLLTDGVLPPEAKAAAPAGLTVTAVGQARPNLAVTRLQAVPSGAGQSQVFVQVRNYGSLTVRSRLSLAVDSELAVEQAVVLAPRGSKDLVLTVPGGGGQVLTAAVAPSGATVTGDGDPDALSVDDAAAVLLAAPRRVTALVASPGNLFLESALAATPGLRVRTAEALPPESQLADVDMVVVDRLPARGRPQRPTLYVAPTVPPPGVAVVGRAELPALAFQAPDHPLMTQVELSAVAIAAAQRLEAPALTEVAGGPDGPVLLAGRLDGTPVVYLAFDLLQSNLPLEPAWPILVANTVAWLAAPPAAQPATAGDTVTVPVPAGATEVVVHAPSGAARRLDPTSPRILVDELGLWRVTAGGKATGAIAVNPAPGEGDLARPRPAPPGEVTGGERRGQAAHGRRRLDRPLVAVALALAAAEWAWTTLRRSGRRRTARRPPQATRTAPVTRAAS